MCFLLDGLHSSWLWCTPLLSDFSHLPILVVCLFAPAAHQSIRCDSFVAFLFPDALYFLAAFSFPSPCCDIVWLCHLFSTFPPDKATQLHLPSACFYLFMYMGCTDISLMLGCITNIMGTLVKWGSQQHPVYIRKIRVLCSLFFVFSDTKSPLSLDGMVATWLGFKCDTLLVGEWMALDQREQL